jgi:uncharacterized protein YceK
MNKKFLVLGVLAVWMGGCQTVVSQENGNNMDLSSERLSGDRLKRAYPALRLPGSVASNAMSHNSQVSKTKQPDIENLPSLLDRSLEHWDCYVLDPLFFCRIPHQQDTRTAIWVFYRDPSIKGKRTGVNITLNGVPGRFAMRAVSGGFETLLTDGVIRCVSQRSEDSHSSQCDAPHPSMRSLFAKAYSGGNSGELTDWKVELTILQATSTDQATQEIAFDLPK